MDVDPLIQADREATVASAANMLDPKNASGLNEDGSFKGLRYDDASDANVRPRGLHGQWGIAIFQTPTLLYTGARTITFRSRCTPHVPARASLPTAKAA